ncbi:MAG: stearoyl-CoA desaturase (delta-9 desaturase) [Gammaproteobacteria bacterium]|jgi:stearoyl-CoA desaturase (delta-9 desaturase)
MNKSLALLGPITLVTSIVFLTFVALTGYEGAFDLNTQQMIMVSVGIAAGSLLGVTVYLHRTVAHRSLQLHPLVEHALRFWLWLTTGMKTVEWVAVHLLHHVTSDTELDPHSPGHSRLRYEAMVSSWGYGHFITGLLCRLWLPWWLFYDGVACYVRAKGVQETLDRYGRNAPTDAIEKHLYSPYSRWCFIPGLALLAALFGFGTGLAMLAIQAFVIPVLAAGVINGVTHLYGYQTFIQGEASEAVASSTGLSRRIGTATNLALGLLIAGEENHNNHHGFPQSARFSLKPWEFDVGWLFIAFLSALFLVRIKSVTVVARIESLSEDVRKLLGQETGKVYVIARFRDKPVTVWHLWFRHNALDQALGA